MNGHGRRWWPSLLAGRAVCACGDYHPCMRSRSVVLVARQDEHWQRSYADELLKDLGPGFGIESPGGTHGLAERLRGEMDEVLSRRPMPDFDAEIEAIEREMRRRRP